MAREAIYFIHDDFDYVFEEKGNTFSALRKIQWAKPGSEPDESKAHLEVRKWYVGNDGEMAGKGFTFSTEEGPNELTRTLVEHGFGNTRELLLELKNRDDFKDSVQNLYNDDSNSDGDGEYFDPREAFGIAN